MWRWLRRRLESHYFEERTVVIAVGTKSDGSWQAAGASGLTSATKRLLVTSNGETQVCWVEARVWFPKEPSLSASGMPAALEESEAPHPAPQHPDPHPQQATPQEPQ